MTFNVKDFNIAQIAESGQCFRWNKIAEMKYRGIIGNKICEIKQTGEEIQVLGIDKAEFEEYFDIGRDYGYIKRFYSKDKALTEAIKAGEGIRILKQDKFETLISFIISANNNIPRIKKSVEAISKRFGKKIRDEYYAFPMPNELSHATEEELRECGVGFRARYIYKTCRDILNGFDLDMISKLPGAECKKELMKLTGVGSKVADCVMLFSMQKVDAFPVDVWIKRIMEELYIKKEVSLKEIEQFAKDKFPLDAGIVQQYLFFYVTGNSSKKASEKSNKKGFLLPKKIL